MRAWPAALVLATALAASIVAVKASEPAGIVLSVPKPFHAPASDASGAPRGISGMACATPTVQGTRECLVINDEETFAEIVDVSDAALTPTGRIVPLINEDEPRKDVVGVQRVPACPAGADGADKLDGEGVAINDGYVYVVSSHSCSGKSRYRPSSFLAMRFRMGAPDRFVGDEMPRVERSWRLADALLASDAGTAFGLRKDDGTNIEGLAVADGFLYAGLRTPQHDGAALIVRVLADTLFAPGETPLDAADVSTFRMPLGTDKGIRDLAINLPRRLHTSRSRRRTRPGQQFDRPVGGARPTRTWAQRSIRHGTGRPGRSGYSCGAFGCLPAETRDSAVTPAWRSTNDSRYKLVALGVGPEGIGPQYDDNA